MSNFSSARFTSLSHTWTHTNIHTLSLTFAAPSPCRAHSSLYPPLPLLPFTPLQPEGSSLPSLRPTLPPSPPDTLSGHRPDQSEASGRVIASQRSVISDWLSKSHSLGEASIHNKHRQDSQGRPSKPLPRKTGGKYLLKFLKVKL